MSTGVVQCWGANANHQLGPNGGSNFSSSTPLTVDGLSSVKDVSVGSENVCAVDTSGGIKCWGDDTYGQLGDQVVGSTGSGAPVSVPGLAGPANSVELGAQNVCVVLKNGSVQCWGRSIGDLSSSPTLTPTTVW
jgi:alpha-tubulin suppressor-like RCC1 family protein